MQEICSCHNIAAQREGSGWYKKPEACSMGYNNRKTPSDEAPNTVTAQRRCSLLQTKIDGEIYTHTILHQHLLPSSQISFNIALGALEFKLKIKTVVKLPSGYPIDSHLTHVSYELK